MALSEFFTDDDLCLQLFLQFPLDQALRMDFKKSFSHIIDRGGDFYLELQGKRFSIDKITGVVTEVE